MMKFTSSRAMLPVALCLAAVSAGQAGPYSKALNDPGNPYDAPVPGFVGPEGEGKSYPDNYVNPLFFAWADGYVNYLPAPGVVEEWQTPEQALGPVTGDNWNIVSLGDLDASQIESGVEPGSITLTFERPIRNKTGADFVVFENGILADGEGGRIFGELAFVEVSSDGMNFARMPNRSLTEAPVNSWGTIDATKVFGLAGKHTNAAGGSWGTPFDLEGLVDDLLVAGAQLDLNAITHIRIVDIPGNGAFLDSQGSPIYDAWLTSGSGGFDLEAVGVISQDMDFGRWQDQRGLAGADRGALTDPDGDGIPNLIEYASALLPDSPDPGTAQQWASHEAGHVVLNFRRDERATDLTLEVERSDDLETWEPIARSVGGGAFEPIPPHAPEISETSASSIASVGVIRQVRVQDAVPPHVPSRFLRLRVIITP